MIQRTQRAQLPPVNTHYVSPLGSGAQSGISSLTDTRTSRLPLNNSLIESPTALDRIQETGPAYHQIAREKDVHLVSAAKVSEGTTKESRTGHWASWERYRRPHKGLTPPKPRSESMLSFEAFLENRKTFVSRMLEFAPPEQSIEYWEGTRRRKRGAFSNSSTLMIHLHHRGGMGGVCNHMHAHMSDNRSRDSPCYPSSPWSPVQT